jgi:hypothetical protein
MAQESQLTTKDTKFHEAFGSGGFLRVPEPALSEVEGCPSWLEALRTHPLPDPSPA